jgi:thioesterase domain-containing protein
MAGQVASTPKIKLSSSVLPLRAHGNHPPLFCMHEENFRDLAGAIQTDRAIYGLRYRCVDDANSSLSIESLAASHLAEILKIQPSGPYYLIGYSIGALVAYEIANSLVNRNESINLLALVDIFNPRLFHDQSYEAVHFRKRYRADRIRKYLRNLLRGELNNLVLDGLKFFKKVRAFVSAKVGGTALTPEMLLRAYSPSNYNGKIVLFRAERPMEGGSEFEHDLSLGWASLAEGGVDVNLVEGTHTTVVKLPYVGDLASKLAPLLR